MLVRPREPCHDHHLTHRTASGHVGIVFKWSHLSQLLDSNREWPEASTQNVLEPNFARRSGEHIAKNLSLDLASNVHEGHLSHLASPLNTPKD